MYRFSRSIYRELAPRVVETPDDPSGCASRQRLLEASEATIRRLVEDRRYFAKPTKTLFTAVRNEFSMKDQLIVYTAIDRYLTLAIEHLDSLPQDAGLGGKPAECQAHTRRGTPCQRDPLPGRDYCPSHKHLEEVVEVDAPYEEIQLRGVEEGIAAAA